jgi:predicted CXXCH cytochrome family protein
MKTYGIPADQPQKYATSVHAEALIRRQDLSAPTCNDCHGNHGAAPPGAASVANVCGTCHVRQSELFVRSPHAGTFECLACHNNHDVSHPTDTLLGTGEASVCITCHSAGDAGYQAAALMHQGLNLLDGRIRGADLILTRAARAGMEVSKPRFELNGAHDSLVNARVAIHSFSNSDVQKVIASGLVVADKAQQSGESALRELLFRRQGLTVSLVLIALASLSIYLKIRQIEAPHKKL